MKKKNKNKQNETWKNLKFSGAVGIIVIGLIFGMLYISNINSVVTVEHVRSWRDPNLYVVADNNPGSGASGFLRIVIVENNVKTWLESWNATDGDMTSNEVFGYADVNNTHIDPDIPFNQAFEIGIKVRWNTTHAYDTGGSQWRLDWVNAWLNCTDPNSCLDHAISSYACDEYHIANNSQYMWVWYVADHTDNGGYYQDRGCNTTGLKHNFNAYY